MEYKTLIDVTRNDSLVLRLVELGASSNDIIVALANEKQRLFQRIIELELIAPKRISTPNGVMVWHCPDHLIPQSDALNPSTVASNTAP